MILLNPGPVNLTAGVREALAGPDLCHRESEFTNLQASIRQKLLDVYGLSSRKWASVLLAGSGTAAVEAMLTTLMPQERKLLVIENGVYGERISTIARVHGIRYRILSHAWGAVLNLDGIQRALALDPDISHVAVVHHETTTGRLNDLAALGSLCRARGVDLLIDAVSSFGAEALDFEKYRIAGCAATANKCLHGAPGVSFVIVRRDQLPAQGTAVRTLYLDLAAYCREQDRRGTPFTQPVQLFYALHQALVELQETGGWQARRARYLALAREVRAGLVEMGIKPLLTQGETSAVLSAYYLPAGISYPSLHTTLKAQGFIIYAGQGELAQRIFRISVMGAIEQSDIDRLIGAFRSAGRIA
jgi:2-aminoethylphosphonate-pyruvate transaminase